MVSTFYICVCSVSVGTGQETRKRLIKEKREAFRERYEMGNNAHVI